MMCNSVAGSDDFLCGRWFAHRSFVLSLFDDVGYKESHYNWFIKKNVFYVHSWFLAQMLLSARGLLRFSSADG